MRTAAQSFLPIRVVAAVVCLLVGAGSATAEKPKVQITAARVGLPPNGRPVDDLQSAHVCKFGTWAPVYLDLEVLDSVQEPVELAIESPDANGVTTTLTVPLSLANARPGTTLSTRTLGSFPYLRPAGGEPTIVVRTAQGQPLSEPFRIRLLRPKDPLAYVVLSLGSRLPGFDLPKAAAGGTGEAETSTGPLRGGRIELAAITDVGLLPDHWFGYEVADVIVLTTGSGEFLEGLFGAKAGPAAKAKQQALLEWVRRGGRLVVSVGANAGAVSRIPDLQSLLPYTVKPGDPSRQAVQLALFWSARETSQTATLSGNLAVKGGIIPVANLVPKPHRAGRVVIPPPSRQGDDKEVLAVQASYGLGRVTLIAFDLDRSPFDEFGQRAEFWDWVLREGGANRASIGSENKPRASGTNPTEDEDELAVALRTHVDTFNDVPVISFGWVAVFIALYILLIGPVEYYVLKRVLGRLELTWVTFPLIVLTVSAAAYFTAYAVKGRDLRVNKVDVIDVVGEFDPQTGKPAGQVFGTTWFTIFSPRIDTFTVGVTPADGWTVPNASGDSLVGWLGGPRGGRASLVRRRYDIHTGSGKLADALVGVPVQVWSTKSFSANWRGPIDPSSPVIESRLEHPPGDPSVAIGTFVNRMPFAEVNDCVAFYAGQAYPLGTILHGQEVRLVLDKGQPATQWLQDKSQLGELLARFTPGDQVQAKGNRPAAGGPALQDGSSIGLPLWGVLFHEAALRNDEGIIPRNASLRRLDESWRLTPDNRDEVIVVGRVLPEPGPAEPLFDGPTSPSRLWLRGTPGAGQQRSPIPGYGRQETYVRLYLPVRPRLPGGR